MKLGKLAKLNNHSTTVFYGVCTGISCNEQGFNAVCEAATLIMQSINNHTYSIFA